MYLPIPTRKSCAQAWVAAASALITRGGESYNVVIDVETPWTHDDEDNAVITLMDKFLKAHDKDPIITVANTIFPQALYEAYGSPEFYRVYHRDFDKFSRETKNWGQYFDRMTRWRVAGGQMIFPLQDLIAKLKRNEAKQRHVKAVYELAVTGPSLSSPNLPEEEEDNSGFDLTIYAPASDRNRPISGPCLSYLSFKRHQDGDLLLTAVYRNHYYELPDKTLASS